VPLEEPAPSVKKTGAVRASTAVPETAVPETSEPELATDASAAPRGNRVMRGLKKLNPKRLFDLNS